MIVKQKYQFILHEQEKHGKSPKISENSVNRVLLKMLFSCTFLHKTIIQDEILLSYMSKLPNKIRELHFFHWGAKYDHFGRLY